MYITKHEARAIIHWLDLANGKWKAGSYMDIEEIFNSLAEFGNVKKKWKWKKWTRRKSLLKKETVME